MTEVTKIGDVEIAYDTGVSYCQELVEEIGNTVEDEVIASAYAGAMAYIAFSVGGSAFDPEEGEKALFKMFQIAEMMFHEGVNSQEVMNDVQ
jgi:hypothetical protein|tara:strand:+ start:1708 stop:1983 length:276 start_codon:yes stop_codon:yes gene_type:complete